MKNEKLIKEIAREIYIKRLPTGSVACLKSAYYGQVSDSYEAAKIYVEEIERLIAADKGEDNGE